MKVRTKRLWAILLMIVMMLSMMPASVFGSGSIPFTATAGGTELTDISESTLAWKTWDGNDLAVPCYTVAVPQGTTSVQLAFPAGRDWNYYTSTGSFIAMGETGGATERTVAVQDSNKDGELDGISVQVPDAWSTEYMILFTYAAAAAECLSVKSDAPTTGTVSAGGLYSLDLNQVFEDSDAHSLTYRFESDVQNQHTKIADGKFYFSVQEVGVYDVTLTAKCAEGKEISHELTMTVEKAADGIAAQYGYEETKKSSVKVNVTVSNDGYPLMAADDETVLSHLEVTVPYFDLGLYGLDTYYRYQTENGKGAYINETIVQRPTGLHLYIYLLERYYMGLPEDQCCLGTSGVLDFAEEMDIFYMDGSDAYSSNGKNALMITGGPTSLYMTNFWGHDENLMYFRNHCYPLMSAGWGSTSDYILLSDGDSWDVAMFSDWNFHLRGCFAKFEKDTYQADAGQELTVKTQAWGTTSEATDFTAKNGLEVGLYDSSWNLVEVLEYDSETGNALTFTTPATDGTYYLMGLGENVMTKTADTAPATAKLIVGKASTGDDKVEVSRILLDTYEKTLAYNGADNTVQLTATVLPAEATEQTVTWTSDNEAVATVDATGLVTAVSEGTAKITAAIGKVTATCTITSEKYNTAPEVVPDVKGYSKIKTNEAFTLDITGLFTDAQDDALTYEAALADATGLTSGWEYTFTKKESVAVADGKCSVKIPEPGVYALVVTANDGKLTTDYTYQLTVVGNDSGTIQLNDGVTMDVHNVAVVDSRTEFVEGFEIPFKGTHDTYVHHIVLSKNTVEGTPYRKMNFTIADGYGWSQYQGRPTQQADWETRADIGMFVYDKSGTAMAHFLQFHTECETHVNENGDRYCDVCYATLNAMPTLAEGVAATKTVEVQTGHSYQLNELVTGKIFTDSDDTLTFENYFYRKSSDGGKTWGERTGFRNLEHGGVNSSFVNTVPGTYIYEFVANDGYGDSEDTWTLTLEVRDKVRANVNFYVGRDQNYSANGNQYPVLELYKTAGIDKDLFDYVGWFTNAEGETEYVYNPHDYEIKDGAEKDYVVIGGKDYELHDYEKIAFTNSAFDAADETATASGVVVNNYNMFYATIETGRYSTRAYGKLTEDGEYDVYLGGQSMALPMETDIYGGGGNDIHLAVVSAYTSSKKIDNTYFTEADYEVQMIMPVTGSMIHSGDAYLKGNYTYYPFLSFAAGNASLYNVYAYPTDTEHYIFNQSINNTTNATYQLVTKSINISQAMTLTITVPEAADFGLYFQYNNFNTQEVEPKGEAKVNGDGTKTITYLVSKGNANYTWRLTDPSGTYVDKAGWLANVTKDTAKTYTFSEKTNKKSHDFSGLGSVVTLRDEGDIQVFLDHSGFKSLSGTHRVRAYRMWQLINSDTANIMIEPKFNVQVLSGNAGDVKQVTGGNAEGNWLDVTPTTTDIVAVNYDAIDVLSTADQASTHAGFFPATSPERTGVFVATNETAGTADAVVRFNGAQDTDRGTEWDYNYDTWYYMDTETAPALDFTVTSSGETTVSYAAVTTDSSLKSKLSSWTTISADDAGSYHASLLPFAGTNGGTVIIKMTDSTGTSYRLVRVAKMSVTATNVYSEGEAIMPGDTVKFSFDGLYRAVNKVAGIFNPLTYYLRYTADETETNGALPQYQKMDNTTVTVKIPEDITFPEGEDHTEYTLTNGYIYGSMYSASSPFDTLYNMTDTGVGTNFSAVGVSFVLSKLADITVDVEKKVYYDVNLNVTDGTNSLTDYTLTLKNAAGEELTAGENGNYQLGYGTYTYSIEKPGYVYLNGSFKLGSADAADVKDGVLTKTIALEKALDGAWDGSAVTEPAKDENGVYQIGTGAELAWLAKTVNGGTAAVNAVLTNDIDLANYQWTPIGTSSKKFAGSFDGQGHKVVHLNITSGSAAMYQGLFGNVAGTASARASIANLTVEGEISLTKSAFTSNIYAAGVIGNGQYVDISNVHANVNVTITRKSGNWNYTGGIIGKAANSTITDCSNLGDIVGYKEVGGIAGDISSSTTIERCFNAGAVCGYQDVGGITGSSDASTVKSCYNTGDITADNKYGAGISAFNSGTAVIENCFNTGKATAASCAGGIAGTVNNVAAKVANAYYLDSSCAVGISEVTGEHTATAVTAQTMAAAEFVTTMNAGLETAAFKGGEAHPILVWQKAEPEVVYGDVSGDGEVTAKDAGMIYSHVNGKIPFTDEQILAADVDGNGEVTAKDAGMVYSYVNNRLAQFPVEANK